MNHHVKHNNSFILMINRFFRLITVLIVYEMSNTSHRIKYHFPLVKLSAAQSESIIRVIKRGFENFCRKDKIKRFSIFEKHKTIR